MISSYKKIGLLSNTVVDELFLMQSSLEKKRLNYIDVAKGLLIIFVVVGHTLAALNKVYPESAFLTTSLDLKKILWVSFYMPAFFFLTGFCSNFDKPFGKFFVANCKSLKVPAVFFGVIYSLGHCLQHGGGSVDVLKIILISPLHSGFWFLDALFISRIVYWFVNRFFFDYKIKMAISFVLFGVSVILWKNLECNDDFFNILHALILTFFISFGQFVRMVNYEFPQKSVLFFIPYIAVCFFLFLNGLTIPSVTRVINIDYNIFPFVLLSLCGTMSVISISKMINQSAVLEYIGRNSLVFYMIHLIVLSPCLKICKKVLPDDAVTVFFVVCVLLFVACAVSSFLLGKRYLKILLGKF